jgi:hypothetical protein
MGFCAFLPYYAQPRIKEAAAGSTCVLFIRWLGCFGNNGGTSATQGGENMSVSVAWSVQNHQHPKLSHRLHCDVGRQALAVEIFGKRTWPVHAALEPEPRARSLASNGHVDTRGIYKILPCGLFLSDVTPPRLQMIRCALHSTTLLRDRRAVDRLSCKLITQRFPPCPVSAQMLRLYAPC